MVGEAEGQPMTEHPKTPQQKQQETMARNREQERKENEAVALERIRREVATRKRWERKGMRRAAK